METIVKLTREVGTSAGVLLPRKWLDKQVVVTLFSPSRGEIAKDIIEIIVNKGVNEDVKGIYLVGSYAREDYAAESDIDVLIITEGTNKLINYKNYEITLVSEQNLSKRLPNSLYYASMLNEAKIILNKCLFEKYSKNKRVLRTRKILDEINGMIKINKENVDFYKENNLNIPDGIIYSIVLRLRELFLIKCLISGKKYSRNDFVKITGEEIYSAYSRIKGDEREIDNSSPDKAMLLLILSEKWLKELKGLKKELKV